MSNLVIAKAKLGALNSLTEEQFIAHMKTALTEAMRILKEEPDKYKIVTGVAPGVVRLKTDARVGSQVAAKAIISLGVFICVNSYKVAEREYPSNEFGTHLTLLQLKPGGDKGKGKGKDFTTVVAMLSAFPDVIVWLLNEKTMQDTIKGITVGGWRFTGDAVPFHFYLNGMQTLAIRADQTDEERREIAKALLCHQQCYVASRTIAGYKNRPADAKITEQRKKSIDFMMNAKNAFGDADRDAVLKAIGTDKAKFVKPLIDIGKQLPEVEKWIFESKDFLEAMGKFVGWVKA